jgi:hypothetical protein
MWHGISLAESVSPSLARHVMLPWKRLALQGLSIRWTSDRLNYVNGSTTTKEIIMEPTAIYAERKGNLAGETVAMSVDAASMAHVMSILTDLYSDPVLAVIREYSTNAFDSHVEAGVQRPIEVSIPNNLSPFFKVRDYGVGLSVEDIRNIYSKYGASTKRSTNEQVGMLGLGCKSALTYTQQFTVRSVKDGELVHVAISRTEDGSGVMQVVAQQKTDEPNGVEISIPSHDVYEFQNKAPEFFKYWKPGTVLLDGAEPCHFKSTAMGDGIYIVENDNVDRVIMGNVAYRVSRENSLYNDYVSYRSRNFAVVAEVPIGSVNFTPSREDLHYTEHTLNTLRGVREKVMSRIEATVQDCVDKCTTPEDGRKEWERWRSMTGDSLKEVTYKGTEIPQALNIPNITYEPNYGRGVIMNRPSIRFNQVYRTVFVHGYEKDELSSSHRAKIRLWAEQSARSGHTFVITKEKIDRTWFTPDTEVSWAEIFATKKPRENRTPNGDETYSVHDGTFRYARQVALSDIDKSKTIIVWSSGEPHYEDNINSIVTFHGDAVAIKLPKNRWAKFLRENAKAVEVDTVVKQLAQDAFDALTDDEKLGMSVDYYDHNYLRMIDPERVDDPELKRYAEIVKTGVNTDATHKFRSLQKLCGLLGIYHPTLDKAQSIRVKYPLLSAVDGYSSAALEHFYIYANHIYSLNKENN